MIGMLKRGLAHRILRLESDPRQLAKVIVQAANNRNYAALGSFLSDDIMFIDPEEQRITGRDDFLLAFRQMAEVMPDMSIAIDSSSRRGRTGLVSGKVNSSRLAQPIATLWEIEVRGDCVSRIHAYRRTSELSMIRLLRQSRLTADIGEANAALAITPSVCKT